MKKDFTAIAVVLDSSGSMNKLSSDTIGNFNRFLDEQKALPGSAVFSLCTFSDTSRMVQDFVDIQSIPSLTKETYKCQGNTALLDAVGSTINAIGLKLAAMPENERPSQVVLSVITDGEENASSSYTADKVRQMIEHQQTKYSWTVLYFGSDLSQIEKAVSYGIPQQNTLSYVPTSAGTDVLYKSFSNTVSRIRSTN